MVGNVGCVAKNQAQHQDAAINEGVCCGSNIRQAATVKQQPTILSRAQSIGSGGYRPDPGVNRPMRTQKRGFSRKKERKHT